MDRWKLMELNVLGSTFNRGITVVQLDTWISMFIQSGTFDTFGGHPVQIRVMPTRSLYFSIISLSAASQQCLLLMKVLIQLTAYARSCNKQFGSKYIDNLGWRDSWALLGQKGFPTGTVLKNGHHQLIPSESH